MLHQVERTLGVMLVRGSERLLELLPAKAEAGDEDAVFLADAGHRRLAVRQGQVADGTLHRLAATRRDTMPHVRHMWQL